MPRSDWGKFLRWLTRCRLWAKRHMPERVWLSWVLVTMVWSRAYRPARRIVQEVATDTSYYKRFISDPRHAILESISQGPGGFAEVGEDTFRLVEARRRFGRRGARVSCLLDMAYIAYKERA